MLALHAALVKGMFAEEGLSVQAVMIADKTAKELVRLHYRKIE